MKLLIGTKELILIYIPGKFLNNHEDFFYFLNYIINKEKSEIHSIYGIFYSNFYEMIRKRTKSEIFSNFNFEKFMFLLEGGNIDAYYENKREAEGFWGIEIRYTDEIDPEK